MVIKKRGKKGQSANEAAVLMTIMTFFLIVAMAAISDDIITASDNNYKGMVQDITDVIEQEALIAFSSENGYYHAFTLPPRLNGQPYLTSVLNSSLIGSQANMTMITVASTRPKVPINITKLLPKEVLGNLVRGKNTVRKVQGVVIFRPIPLTPAQQGYCLAGCGSSGAVAPEECCDQGYSGCCTEGSYSCFGLVNATFYSAASDGEVSWWDNTTSYLAVHDNATGIVTNTGIPPGPANYLAIGQTKMGSWWQIRRAFFFFNTSSLGAGTEILSAVLSLYGRTDSSDTNFDITIQNGQPTYPRNPLAAGDYNKNLYSGNGGSLSTAGFATNRYNNIALNAAGISWINKTGTTKFSLRSSRDIDSIEMTGTETVVVWTTEQGAGYQPRLVVTYSFPQPCGS